MAYTKKELLKCLENVNDDAIVQINIITAVGDGTEEGQLFDIEAFGVIAPTTDFPGEAQVICYNLAA